MSHQLIRELIPWGGGEGGAFSCHLEQQVHQVCFTLGASCVVRRASCLAETRSAGHTETETMKTQESINYFLVVCHCNSDFENCD